MPHCFHLDPGQMIHQGVWGILTGRAGQSDAESFHISLFLLCARITGYSYQVLLARQGVGVGMVSCKHVWERVAAWPGFCDRRLVIKIILLTEPLFPTARFVHLRRRQLALPGCNRLAPFSGSLAAVCLGSTID